MLVKIIDWLLGVLKGIRDFIIVIFSVIIIGCALLIAGSTILVCIFMIFVGIFQTIHVLFPYWGITGGG